MTKQIDLVFKVQCRICGSETVFDLDQVHTENPPLCSACGHSFSVSSELARSLRQQVTDFMDSLPSGKTSK